MVRAYSAALGFKIGAYALRATAATNALDHQAGIAKVQDWLGHANIATMRIYDHRRMRPEDSPTSKSPTDNDEPGNYCASQGRARMQRLCEPTRSRPYL
jgi:hypothetical protein